MTNIWKLPPRVKVLEALGSIADGRVKMQGNSALVISSDHDKTYIVKFDKKSSTISSTDNGSVFRGYLGYPPIAFLMLKKILPYDATISFALKSIRWKKINEKFKNYFKTEEFAKKIASKYVDSEKVDKFVEKTLKKIKELKLRHLVDKDKNNE